MAKAKTDSTEKRGRGRPRIEIDVKILEGLARIQCNMKEMAAILGCSVDTLERNYADVIDKAREGGKMTLRRHQFRMAENNVAMAIWLGKQYLGQKEPEREISKDAVEDVRKIIGDVVKEMKEGI